MPLESQRSIFFVKTRLGDWYSTGMMPSRFDKARAFHSEESARKTALAIQGSYYEFAINHCDFFEHTVPVRQR